MHPQRKENPSARLRGHVALLLLLVPALGLPAANLHAQRVLGTPAQERSQAAASGDFQTGDVVQVTILNEPELSGDFVVDDQMMLDMKRLGKVSVRGIRRSAAIPLVEQRVRRVVVSPGDLTVRPLVRLAVLGSVGKPGFYQVPAAASLPEVITVAGGPTQSTDLDRVEIERGGDELIGRERVAEAISAGRTVDQLGLRSGDQIEVGERSQRNVWRTVRDVAYGVGAIVTLVTLGTRIF